MHHDTTVLPHVIDSEDAKACVNLLRRGSKSFYLASRLLPVGLKSSVTALYAFCREADDAVDTAQHAALAVEHLHKRLDCIYIGVNLDNLVDRCLARTVQNYQLPRALFNALLEGFAWDAAGRAYASLHDVIAYSARVAGSIGVLMTLMMGQREPWVLGRAAELGVAMQFTNMARDVGEDARLGRLYLPTQWFTQAGISPASWLQQPTASPAIRGMIQRLLACAAPLYSRADDALTALPFDCRLAIHSASRIYRDIGRSIARQQYDTLSYRASVSLPRKIWLALSAMAMQIVYAARPPPQPGLTTMLPEVRFLVAAVYPIAESTPAPWARSAPC